MAVRETLKDWGGVVVLLGAMGGGYVLLSNDIDRLDDRIVGLDARLDDIAERLTRVEVVLELRPPCPDPAD